MALDTFQAGPGAAIVRAVKEAIPDLAALPMVALPTSTGNHVRVELPSTETLANTVSWVNANAQRSGLAVRLEEQWEQLHRPIMDEEIAAPHAEPAGLAATECCLAGVCLCSSQGKKLKARSVRFMAYMKTLTTERRGFKHKLDGGYLVVKVEGAPAVSDGIACDGGPIVAWLHIGVQYFQPYEPWFAVVEPIDDPHRGAAQ